MLYAILALSVLAGIGALVCWIMVEIKMFGQESKIPAIIGIVTCGIYTFIWGWQNQPEKVSKNLMIGYTVAVVIGILARVLTSFVVTGDAAQ